MPTCAPCLHPFGACCYAESTAPHVLLVTAPVLLSHAPCLNVFGVPVTQSQQHLASMFHRLLFSKHRMSIPMMVGRSGDGRWRARRSHIGVQGFACSSRGGSGGRREAAAAGRAVALGVAPAELAQARAVVAAANARASRGCPEVPATVHASVPRKEGGPCTVDSAGCVSSPNYSFEYGNADCCRISISPAAPVIALEFQVGSD